MLKTADVRYQLINDLTAYLLDKYQIKGPPIDIEHIIKAENIKVVKTTLGKNVSGISITDGDNKIIAINETETNKERQRFTLAHELGHLLLHKEQNLIISSYVVMSRRDENSTTGIDRREIEANAFAASLLMPKKLLEKELKDKKQICYSDIVTLIKDFKVSEQSMFIRLKSLGFISYYED